MLSSLEVLAPASARGSTAHRCVWLDSASNHVPGQLHRRVACVLTWGPRLRKALHVVECPAVLFLSFLESSVYFVLWQVHLNFKNLRHRKSS